MIEHVSFFVADAPLHRGVLTEHGPDRLAQRLSAVDHDQHALLGVQAAVDEIR